MTQTIEKFAADLASAAPTPGGGSTAALVGALSSALGEMVGHIRQDKVGETRLTELVAEMTVSRTQMLSLIKEDEEGFDAFTQALKLPKETDEQKRVRTANLQQGLVKAAQPPLKIAQTATKILHQLEEMKEFSSKSLLSDIGSGTALAEAALKASVLNVYENTRMLKDQQQAETLNQETDRVLNEGLQVSEKLYPEMQKAARGE
ncbi:putative serine cycle enzyme [Ligilactobacillus salitolerans]|uniref:Putative serine cycle enzyme n=1 Tax=Ligilactobacillus salitolerans TaxID=1808352 RepID=A0A401IQB8_9LACO|nr:cyclodeaminase/cyclohydrolase family protein [Ligilactobacillus salitolerans]GBG93716.1 putative serine cycle enzyme [Ligilactobacillus salitolerans]